MHAHEWGQTPAACCVAWGKCLNCSGLQPPGLQTRTPLYPQTGAPNESPNFCPKSPSRAWSWQSPQPKPHPTPKVQLGAICAKAEERKCLAEGAGLCAAQGHRPPQSQPCRRPTPSPTALRPQGTLVAVLNQRGPHAWPSRPCRCSGLRSKSSLFLPIPPSPQNLADPTGFCEKSFQNPPT